MASTSTWPRITSVSAPQLRTIGLLLAAAGIGVAGYLTYVHYGELSPVCVGGGGGCERVQNSEYSEIAGIPVALFGLLTYIAIAAAQAVYTDTTRLFAAGAAVIAFAFSLYLTYLELFVIDAICQWCVASAVIATLLAPTTVALALKIEEPAGAG